MLSAALLLAIALPSSTQATTEAAAPTSQVAASTAPSRETLALIEQLNADDGTVRQNAQDQLVLLGDAAVPALREAMASSAEEEVRQRASAALVQIIENQTVGPSIINIHAHDMPMRDLFAELARQAGAPIEPIQPEFWDSRSWPTVSIDVDNEPFWTAVREISDQTGIELGTWNDGIGLMPSQNHLQIGRHVVSGPFLVALVQELRSQNIMLGEKDASTTTSSFMLQFSALAEPKLKVLRCAALARLDEATDDAGTSMLPTDVDKQPFRRRVVNDESMNPGSGASWGFSAQLAYPVQTGRRLAMLRGSVGVVLQTASESVEIRDILAAKNAKRDVGGLRLTVTSMKKLEDRYQLDATITRDPTNKTTSDGLVVGDRIAWERVQATFNDLKLVDQQDRPLRRINISTNGNDQAYQLTLTFSSDNAQRGQLGRRLKPGEPSKLTWTVPTQIRQERVPFEFHDLPLPN